jgi:hypothetical protein
MKSRRGSTYELPLDVFENKIIKSIKIDPSIEIRHEIIEFLDMVLVKLQSYSHNEEVVKNIFEVLMEKFNIETVRDIMGTTISKEDIKQLERSFIIKKLLD